MSNAYKSARTVLLFVALLLSSYAMAQRAVTGKVASSTDNAPLPGVTVIVKGTTNGAITDADGKYSINVTSDADVLVFSSIGFKTQQVTVGSQSTIDLALVEDLATLDEVVVTGYSSDNRRDVTSAVSTVKAKDLTVIPSGNVEQQLQGRVPGVTVITNGQPGTTSQIRIRGFGSFGGNEPLYIVDGVPVPTTEFLNPDDIETTTVLKDAAGASIYGARAAGGVVIYTTKKGAKGGKKLNVTYDALVGITDPGKGQQMMNPQDFATWTWKAKFNTGAIANDPLLGPNHPQFGNGATPVIPDYLIVGGQYGVTGNIDLNAQKALYNVDLSKGDAYQVVAANKGGTDWYKAITRQAPVTRHTIGISGGGENSRFYFGLSLQDQKGILLANTFKRYAFRANSEFNVFKRLRIGENLQFTYRSTNGLTGGNGGQGIAQDENDILQAFRMPSIIPVYDVFGGYAGTAAKGFNNPQNPRARQDRSLDNRGYSATGFGNVYLEYEPIDGLTLRTSIGGRYINYAYRTYSPPTYENSENQSNYQFGEGSGYTFGYTFTNTANYKKKFGLHAVDVLIGEEALNTGAGRTIDATGTDPFSYSNDYVNLNTVSSKKVFGGSYKGVNFYSLFGRLNYAFNDKYLASFVIRRDAASRFGANTRSGTFPAFSLGWRISSEEFMKSISWISDLKIRGGYGAMGNSNNVDPNNQFTLYGTNIGASSYNINGDNTNVAEGYYRTQIGNPDAKWETSISKNIGFDGTFLNGKLDVVLEFWQKDTKDLLVNLAIPATNGSAAPPAVNSANMVNKGIDIMLGTKGKVNEVGFEVVLNGSFLKNQITSIASGQTYLGNVNPSYRGIQPIRNQIGQSISAFYGYQVVGLFSSQAEIDAAAKQSGVVRTQDANADAKAGGVGRFHFADVNGDGVIDEKDRTYLGSPVPKFTGGLFLKATYKSFEINTYLYTSIGNKIFNQSRWFTDFYPSFAGAAISERVKGSWTPENKGATIPIFENVSNFSTNTQSNSFYIEDGSYLRMQNINLAYNLPGAMLGKLKMSKFRIYAGVNNIFTITKYKGLDPGVGGNADTAFGVDIGNYPITRSFTFGVNLGI